MPRFIIYRRGRWRAVDLETGRVEGIQERMQFLVIRDGQAVKLRKERVLKELRKYNEGLPSGIGTGELVDSDCAWQKKRQREKRLVTPPQAAAPKSAPVDADSMSPRVVISRCELPMAMLPPTRLPPMYLPKRIDAREPRLSLSSVASNRNSYNEEEDMCILQWLLDDQQRIGRIRGNMLWQELEGEFKVLCGHARSWHSLRNRFLRMLLPALSNANSELSSRVSPESRSLLCQRKRSVMENSLVSKHNKVIVGASSRRKHAAVISSSDSSDDMDEDDVPLQTHIKQDGKRKLYNHNK